ncbi:uncharacterized protein LOC121733316 [Aricia agestis]|uniref:uncharacterized protein LOC121733316 n=1 Tax=Aricia agestis TaxID=91739 RepID=UPI001C20C38B|nr:uncharacterized protein LOC121733316 [Aricia agestis]
MHARLSNTIIVAISITRNAKSFILLLLERSPPWYRARSACARCNAPLPARPNRDTDIDIPQSINYRITIEMCSARFVRISKYLLAGVAVFCVSWLASVNEWSSWSHRAEPLRYSTMRTIVGYSEGARAERDRPSPVACTSLPAYPEVPNINRTWQRNSADSRWQKVKGTSISLYAAYYDTRTSQPYVRILAMYHGRNASKEELYCQTRPNKENEATVEVVAAKPLEMWWREWDSGATDVDTPVLLSCPLTENLTVPSVVSVVKEPCDDPTNAFNLSPITDSKEYKRTFTICVKDMYFRNDISRNLVEWIETNKLLGVDKIDIYIDAVHEINERILEHYRRKGFVRLYQVPIKSKPERTLWQRRRDHIITYNDCLYRNIQESEYIVPLDVDEILLPKRTYTWSGLLKRLVKKGWNPYEYSAILVRNIFFFDFMQNKYIDANINTSKIYTKRDDVRIDNENLIEKELELENKLESIVNNDSLENIKGKLDCTEETKPKLVSHIMSSAVVSPVGHYSKSIMVTKRVLTAFNHYPLADFGSSGFTIWSAPFSEVQLNHYKESCNTTLVSECERYAAEARADHSAMHLRGRLMRALALTCSIIKTAQ